MRDLQLFVGLVYRLEQGAGLGEMGQAGRDWGLFQGDLDGWEIIRWVLSWFDREETTLY